MNNNNNKPETINCQNQTVISIKVNTDITVVPIKPNWLVSTR